MIITPSRAQKAANIPMFVLVRSFPVSIILTLPKGSTSNDFIRLDISAVSLSSLGVTGTLPVLCIRGECRTDLNSFGICLLKGYIFVPDEYVTLGVAMENFSPCLKNFINLGVLDIIWANFLLVQRVSSKNRFLTLGKNNRSEKIIMSCALLIVKECRLGNSLDNGLMQCVPVVVGNVAFGSSSSKSMHKVGRLWLYDILTDSISFVATLKSHQD